MEREKFLWFGRYWKRRLDVAVRDWRTWVVFGSVVAAYGITLVVGFALDAHLHQDHVNVWLGFYSSWTASVLFFSLVGVAALIYSTPSQPDTATYSERIRAFYGRLAPDSLRDYAAEQLKRFGGYNEESDRQLEVVDYHYEYEAYKIEVRSSFVIRNIFLDVSYLDSSSLKIYVDDFNCVPDVMGEVDWIDVGGENVLKNGKLEIPEGGFEYPLTFPITPGGKIKYSYKYWVWHKIDVESNQRPKRVTETSSTKIRNNMKNKVLRFSVDGGRNVELQPGACYDFPKVKGATPDEDIFGFTLQSPETL